MNTLNGSFKEFKYSIKKISDVNSEEIEKKISEISDESDWWKFIKSDSQVLIKPNFTLDHHKPGVTTSPIVLKSLIKILHKKTQEITIIEGNGGSYLYTADEAAINHGIKELKKEFGINWINVSKLNTKKISGIINSKKINIKLPEDVNKMGNVLISVPVFKNHCMTTISLGMKNLWGLVPSEMRMLNHSKINYYLPLIGDYYNHKITLIDGIVGLEGNGPMFGNPIEMNTLFGSNNPVIADVIGALIIQVNPKIVRHIVDYAKFRNYDINAIIKSVSDEINFFSHKLEVKRTPSNYLDLLTFKSRSISKIVFESPFTPIIYKLFNLINGDRISIPPNELKKKINIVEL